MILLYKASKCYTSCHSDRSIAVYVQCIYDLSIPSTLYIYICPLERICDGQSFSVRYTTGRSFSVRVRYTAGRSFGGGIQRADRLEEVYSGPIVWRRYTAGRSFDEVISYIQRADRLAKLYHIYSGPFN